MRRNTIIVTVLSLVLLFSITAFAHPGKTDSKGGHYDYSTGIYHYHHGYPAHQHTNGQCPYDFDDRTGWNSGTSSDNNKSSTSSSSVQVQNTPEEKDHSITFSDVIAFIIVSPFVFWLILSGIHYLKIFVKGVCCFSVELFQAIAMSRKFKKLEKEEYNQKRQEYSKLYEGIEPIELVDIPEGATIDENDLPHQYIKKRDIYTVYINNNSSTYVFHKRKTCKPNLKETNYVKCQNRRPCLTCRPQNPDVTWYYEYIKIKEIKKKYNIK